jgi:hypothetical protein
MTALKQLGRSCAHLLEVVSTELACSKLFFQLCPQRSKSPALEPLLNL